MGAGRAVGLERLGDSGQVEGMLCGDAPGGGEKGGRKQGGNGVSKPPHLSLPACSHHTLPLSPFLVHPTCWWFLSPSLDLGPPPAFCVVPWHSHGLSRLKHANHLRRLRQPPRSACSASEDPNAQSHITSIPSSNYLSSKILTFMAGGRGGGGGE